MPRYNIPICDTWIEQDGDTAEHALQLLHQRKLSDLMSWVDFNIGDPELIREEKPLRSIRSYLTPTG